MLRIEETPMEGSARTKTILSLRFRAALAAGAGACPGDAGSTASEAIRAQKKQLERNMGLSSRRNSSLVQLGSQGFAFGHKHCKPQEKRHPPLGWWRDEKSRRLENESQAKFDLPLGA